MRDLLVNQTDDVILRHHQGVCQPRRLIDSSWYASSLLTDIVTPVQCDTITQNRGAVFSIPNYESGV